MICDQCGSEVIVRIAGTDGSRFFYRLVCDDCGNVVATHCYPCERCERIDADPYTAKLTDVFPNEYTGRRRTRRYKIYRCEECAKQLPPRWAKQAVA